MGMLPPLVVLEDRSILKEVSLQDLVLKNPHRHEATGILCPSMAQLDTVKEAHKMGYFAVPTEVKDIHKAGLKVKHHA